MIDDNTLIEVQNLADHAVVYISYEGRRRKFNKGQKMKLPAGELRQLIYTRGGEVLIKDYLSIRNRELAEELGVDMENYDEEYSWTQEDVDKALEEDDIDVLADALDFAPRGIIDLIISRAIELNLRDFQKRELIKHATGKDITALIEMAKQTNAAISKEDGAINNNETKTRRRAKNAAPAAEDAPKKTRRSSKAKVAEATTETAEETAAE